MTDEKRIAWGGRLLTIQEMAAEMLLRGDRLQDENKRLKADLEKTRADLASIKSRVAEILPTLPDSEYERVRQTVDPGGFIHKPRKGQGPARPAAAPQYTEDQLREIGKRFVDNAEKKGN